MEQTVLCITLLGELLQPLRFLLVETDQLALSNRIALYYPTSFSRRRCQLHPQIYGMRTNGRRYGEIITRSEDFCGLI